MGNKRELHNIILGIETATEILSICIIRNTRCLKLYGFPSSESHCERLIPLIEETLTEVGLKYEDITGIAVSSGPGSFTGLRIGVNTAKTLARFLNIPLCAVGTLMGIAARLPACEGLICPMINARRDRVYCALYRMVNHELKEYETPFVTHVTDLVSLLVQKNETVTFTGCVLDLLKKLACEHLPETARFADMEFRSPSAETIALLGLERIKMGIRENPMTYEPFYLQSFKAGRKRKINK